VLLIIRISSQLAGTGYDDDGWLFGWLHGHKLISCRSFLFFLFSRFSFFAIISSLVLKNPCQRNERSPGTLMKILAAGLAQSQWIYIYKMFNSEFYH